MDYLHSPIKDSFFLFPTTRREIEVEISNLRTGKAVGPFSIPIDILKIIKCVVSKPLEILINASFSTGIVPHDLKLANVVPVYKKGPQTSLSNYRPISLLSIFNKLLERLMYNRMIKFLEKNDIFYTKQFGFRSKHSTDHAILCIIDRIQKAIDNRSFSCGIFLDFSKAFDTVNHEILIHKLEYYGFRGLVKQWFISYLSERRQIVTVNSVKSAECSVSCGIPQGSVLGPLLFLLYINDFSESSNVFDFHLFADDANLFYEAKNLSALETTVNCELANVYTWLCANRLSLNIDKSNYVLFHPPQRNIQRFSFSLSINNQQLKREYCIKYLGLMIDSNLSWKKQVECVVKKVRRGISILSKIRHYITRDILKSLYYTLIYPFLIYGLIA